MRIDVGQKMAEKRKYKTGKSRNRTLERADRETERLLEKRPVCDICSVFLNVGVHSLCEQIRKDKSFSNLLESQKAFRKGFKNVDDRRLQDCKEDPFITYGLRKTHYTKRTRIVCDVCQVSSDGVTNHSYCKTLLNNFFQIGFKFKFGSNPSPKENSQICDVCQMRFDDSETDHDFCFQFKQKIQYFKDQQVKAEALKRELEIEEEKALEYQEEMPQVNFEKYPCPVQNCQFLSTKKYNGIRIHLLKHFKERIQKDAMQINWMTDYSEKDTCFNKTSCNTELLLKKGELVHHYGLLHCLVDDILHEYAQNRIKLKHKEDIQNNLCPYGDYTFTSYRDLLTHLINSHYFNIILEEVKVMLDFTSLYGKHRYTQKRIKCPYCKKRFNNLLSTGKAKDVTEIVLHCGLEHGYAAYYLLADNNVDQMKELLTQFHVKKEPEEEMVDQDTVNGASHEESDINNFLQVQVEDIKGELFEDFDEMEEHSDAIVKQEAVEEEDDLIGIKSESKSLEANDCILGI